MKVSPKIKERYVVCKSVDGEVIGRFLKESEALNKLKTLDPDWHFIQRQVDTHIADGIYDFEVDESYGVDGNKWMCHFQSK